MTKGGYGFFDIYLGVCSPKSSRSATGPKAAAMREEECWEDKITDPEDRGDSEPHPTRWLAKWEAERHMEWEFPLFEPK
jgi:hypothetical protein